MFFKKKRNSGFTLVEIIISLAIISTILLVAIQMFVPTNLSSAYLAENLKINLLLNTKYAQVKSLGFWIRNVDTSNPEFPNNPYDPAVIWANEFSNVGYNRKATITTTFLKENANILINFTDNAEFDGQTPRNKVKIDLKIFNSKNQSITRTFTLFMYPAPEKLQSQLSIIKNALLIYAYENSAYPASDHLETLVPDYLAEIPNDPYTQRKEKTTHTEEKTDWNYTNTGSTITLSPNSHRENSDFIETWNY